MSEKRIGIISDTHCLLREEAIQALAKSELIIHAGDIGSPDILKDLERITKVIAVRGNMDKGEWAKALPTTQLIQVDELTIYVIHDIDQMDIDPVAAKVNIVIYGHSHKPIEKREQDIIYINPGSAGPKRFNLPISMAILKKYVNQIEIEFIGL